MNMFKPVGATTNEEYISRLEGDRKKIVEFLDAFIKKASTDLKPHFASNMLGYGSFKYKNYKKEIIDWPTVALAAQKNYISIYICALEDGEYIAEKYKDKLGRVSVGRSCIRFKKLEDLNLSELEKIIKKAAKNPGITV
jgi:hypothetical protein